jgi:hypothetical protein
VVGVTGAVEADEEVETADDVEPGAEVEPESGSEAGSADSDPSGDSDPPAEEAEVAEPEAESDDDGSGGSEPPPSARADRSGGSWWRERRIVVPAVVAVLSLSLAAVLIVAGRSGEGGDGSGGDLGALPTMPPTTIDTGGIEVPTPDGWTAAPVPDLDFGIALPPAWEAVVLRQEMLASLGRSDPAVTGFVEAAHAAAESGAVFYAAGEDDQSRVTDLKLRAAPQTGIADEAGLEAYARQLAAAAGAPDAPIEPVDGAEHPTLRYEFTTTAESPEGDRVTFTGIETLVLGPGDIVWSLIVTGEDADLVARLAPEIVSTLTLVE